MNIISGSDNCCERKWRKWPKRDVRGKEGVLESRVALLTKWPLNGDLTRLRQEVVGR